MSSYQLQKKQEIDPTHRFMEAVMDGFAERPRSISSMFFYDDEGDRLFQKITELPSYYLTKAEDEILQLQYEQILSALDKSQNIRIIELGAGDGRKSLPFIKRMLDAGLSIDYVPVDISNQVLELLKEKFHSLLPSLIVHPFSADYFNVQFPDYDGQTLWMYMGSNIGNLNTQKARQLLLHLHESAQEEDILLMGFDLQKNPERIIKAYDDPEGVTRAFNLNLLSRMNRELGADFDLSTWQHYATYHPQSGEARSYLIATEEQEIHFQLNGFKVFFKAWEALHTETSRKYRVSGMRAFCESAGWGEHQVLHDKKRDYALGLYQRI